MTRTGQLEMTFGMDAALKRTSEEWIAAARYKVAEFCRYRVEFDAEDLRAAVGDPPGSPNALGALLHHIAAEGWIIEVGTTRSRRPGSHGRILRRWRSAS